MTDSFVSELSGSNVVLGPGEHVHPFSFQIPDRNLPSSYEGLYGFVRYIMKAVINRPWKFDLSSKTALTVLEVVDVNKQDFLVRLMSACITTRRVLLTLLITVLLLLGGGGSSSSGSGHGRGTYSGSG